MYKCMHQLHQKGAHCTKLHQNCATVPAPPSTVRADCNYLCQDLQGPQNCRPWFLTPKIPDNERHNYNSIIITLFSYDDKLHMLIIFRSNTDEDSHQLFWLPQKRLLQLGRCLSSWRSSETKKGGFIDCYHQNHHQYICHMAIIWDKREIDERTLNHLKLNCCFPQHDKA